MYKGNFAGLIGFNNVDWERKCTSIGYWLGESFQGKGIMTKALETFINYAFSTMHLNKIEIPIAEGTIRDAEWLYDRYVNHVMYGLLKHEWSARQ